MDSVDQVKSQAWSLWAKLAAPALLRCPALGISAVLVVSTPLAAVARTLPRTQELVSTEPTQRQLHVLHSYERYLALMRTQSAKAGRAVQFAYQQLGKPYQWGGAGPRTYDCSGLVMAAWRKGGGLSLPHRADLQHRMIRRKVGLKHLRPGDLVFFSGDHHVGIYVGRRQFLHAPHTGARVQRGTLSGWRLRAFAGAARPGAPAYHAWPLWVRALAGRLDEHADQRPRRRRGPGHARPAVTHAPRAEPAPVVEQLPAEPADDAAAADGPATGPDTGPDTGTGTGTETGPDTGMANSRVTGQESGTALPAPSAEPDGPSAYPQDGSSPERSSVPMLTMSARGRRHNDVPPPHDDTPAPAPAPTSAPPPAGAHAPWPRTAVRKQNDEQRFDRVFDGRSDGGDGDAGDPGEAGDIDLGALLRAAP